MSRKLDNNSQKYNKEICSVYSLGSTETVEEEEEDEEDIAREIRGKCLGQVFTEKHVNLITVIGILMERRDLQILVQKPLLDSDDAYWNTGKYEYSELDLVKINLMLLIGAGRIQQVVVSALQILYDVGAKNKDGDDYSVLFYMNKKKKMTNVRISFKFNKQNINLSIVESKDDSYLSLYIED